MTNTYSNGLTTEDQYVEDPALVAALRYKDSFPSDVTAIHAFLGIASSGTELTQAIRHFLAGFGPDIKPPRFRLLRALYMAEGKRFPLNKLAKETSIAPSNITYQLHILEEAGLVQKATSATDARVTYAELTATGDKLCRTLVPAMVNFMRTVSGDLTEADLRVLASLVARFRGGISHYVESQDRKATQKVGRTG